MRQQQINPARARPPAEQPQFFPAASEPPTLPSPPPLALHASQQPQHHRPLDDPLPEQTDQPQQLVTLPNTVWRDILSRSLNFPPIITHPATSPDLQNTHGSRQPTRLAPPKSRHDGHHLQSDPGAAFSANSSHQLNRTSQVETIEQRRTVAYSHQQARTATGRGVENRQGMRDGLENRVETTDRAVSGIGHGEFIQEGQSGAQHVFVSMYENEVVGVLKGTFEEVGMRRGSIEPAGAGVKVEAGGQRVAAGAAGDETVTGTYATERIRKGKYYGSAGLENRKPPTLEFGLVPVDNQEQSAATTSANEMNMNNLEGTANITTQQFVMKPTLRHSHLQLAPGAFWKQRATPSKSTSSAAVAAKSISSTFTPIAPATPLPHKPSDGYYVSLRPNGVGVGTEGPGSSSATKAEVRKAPVGVNKRILKSREVSAKWRERKKKETAILKTENESLKERIAQLEKAIGDQRGENTHLRRKLGIAKGLGELQQAMDSTIVRTTPGESDNVEDCACKT